MTKIFGCFILTVLSFSAMASNKLIVLNHNNEIRGGSATQKDKQVLEKINARVENQICKLDGSSLRLGSLVTQGGNLVSLKANGNTVTIIHQNPYGSVMDLQFSDPQELTVVLSNDQTRVLSYETKYLDIKKIQSKHQDHRESDIRLVLNTSSEAMTAKCK